MKIALRKYLSRKGDKYWWRLDFSPKLRDLDTGKMYRFKSLGTFTYVKPKNSAEKDWNNEMKIGLENMRTEAYINWQNEDFDFIKSKKEDRDFLEYFLALANKRDSSSSNYFNWMLVHEYLKEFSETIRFKDLDRKFANDFKDYLLNKPHGIKKAKKLSINSASSYYTKFLYALKQAYKDGILRENLAYEVGRIKGEETKRIFLTHEEVKNLYKTDCKDNVLKRVCLFMAHTGMRISDVEKLTWNEIEESENTGFYIRFKHQKTKSQQTLPLSNEAYELLGIRPENEQLVFGNFVRRYRVLKTWAKDAGIKKNIGFHTFRHTLATLLLNEDVNVFTVKEILGHKDIKTTMSYVNLLDKKKIEAVNTISFRNKKK